MCKGLNCTKYCIVIKDRQYYKRSHKLIMKQDIYLSLSQVSVLYTEKVQFSALSRMCRVSSRSSQFCSLNLVVTEQKASEVYPDVKIENLHNSNERRNGDPSE